MTFNPDDYAQALDEALTNALTNGYEDFVLARPASEVAQDLCDQDSNFETVDDPDDLVPLIEQWRLNRQRQAGMSQK